METSLKEPKKRRAVVYIDRDVFRLARQEQVERDIPLSHVIEESLVRRYAGKSVPTKSFEGTSR